MRSVSVNKGFQLDNISRVIPSGLSVVGWYSKPDENGLCSVHVDLVFSVAKFGEAETDKIEFELALRRCELVVVFVDAAVPKVSTMARSSYSFVGTETRRIWTEAGAEIRGEAQADLLRGANLQISGRGNLASATTSTHEFQRQVCEFIVQHSMTPENDPRWEVRRSDGSRLIGSPWDAGQARIKFEPKQSKVNEEPFIRLEVRCKREDLDFGEGPRLKEENQNTLFRSKKNNATNLAAAEQYLKSILLEQGLQVSNISHKYGDLTLADVVIYFE